MPNDYAMSGGKNNFEKIKNMITKDDLKKAFEQGERYDYRVTKAQCFNRWYNQNYLDAENYKDGELDGFIDWWHNGQLKINSKIIKTE